jgi:diguanylate cyclase (GGDEF)-like protein
MNTLAASLGDWSAVPWLPWSVLGLVAAVLVLLAVLAMASFRRAAKTAQRPSSRVLTEQLMLVLQCDDATPFAVRCVWGEPSRFGLAADAFARGTLTQMVHPDDMPALLRATVAASPVTVSLRLSTKGRAAPSFLDPHGGQVGRSPALGTLISDGELWRTWVCGVQRQAQPPHSLVLVLLPAPAVAPSQPAAPPPPDARLEQLQQLVDQQGATQRFLEDLQQITERLQFCDDTPPAYQMVAEACARLFPGWNGHLAIASTQGILDIEGEWGTGPKPRAYDRDACWAVKRSKVHFVSRSGIKPMCPHASVEALLPGSSAQTICAPLNASTGVFGVVHLHRSDEVSEIEMAMLAWRATTFADAVALSLTNLRLRASLRDQAVRDGMTGLFNRREFDEVMHRETSRSARSGEPLTLAIFDIDHFKSFNDAFGHEAGDAVICAVARQLQTFGRSYDIACRVGGEELAMLMPRTHADEALTRLEALREHIGRMKVNFEDQTLPAVTVSVGVADTADGVMEDLFRRADTALYEAKRGGRNQIQQWRGGTEVGVETIAGATI